MQILPPPAVIVGRYPGFTDYVAGTPQTLVLETRMNSRRTALSQVDQRRRSESQYDRPSQDNSFQLSVAAVGDLYQLAKCHRRNSFISSMPLIPSNTVQRIISTWR